MRFHPTSALPCPVQTPPTFFGVGLSAAWRRWGALIVAVLMLLCGSVTAWARTELSVDTPAPSAPASATSDQRFQQAVHLAEQQRHAAALVIFEELADQPQVPLEVLNNMAVIYAQQGRYALARSIFEQALRHDPTYAAVYDNLLTVHGLLARQAYARALVLEGASPGEAQVSMNLIRAWTPPVPSHDRSAELGGGSSTPESVPMLPVAMQATTDNPLPLASSAAIASASTPTVNTPSTAPAPVMNMQAAFSSLVSPRFGIVTAALVVILVLIAATAATAAMRTYPQAPSPETATTPPYDSTSNSQGSHDSQILPLSAPEARLIEIYRLIGQARIREALGRAENLVRDLPEFHLGQLIYGDLLMAQTARLSPDGHLNRPLGTNSSSTEALAQLELEAARRIQALRETPAPGTVPRQLLLVAPKVRFVVAVDASRSRLYLLENKNHGLTLVSHRYVSIGRNGVDKWVEGDQRTPLGVYDITEKISADKLTDLYGAGALPINFPNEYDQRVGRSGRGIWLHGVPKADYVRAPQSSNGCIVLANDDMRQILRDLVPMNTPVVVAEHLEWVQPATLDSAKNNAMHLLNHWHEMRQSNDPQPLIQLYSRQFWNGTDDFEAFKEKIIKDHPRQATFSKDRSLSEVSILGWRDRYEILVITFTENHSSSIDKHKKSTKRQYWVLEGGQWKIFYEGTIA
ncbi:MAG: L,D-transpeptidase family protein [Leptothrix ochracea]|uniref:L,D-transpeptidase family protein n=1 Tax=Leptothrix ochracea TaxID=735331 RepID=UPI0034E1DFE4